MSANFVIVCGGTGKGIIRRFKEMDITAVLQIDVDAELIQMAQGGVYRVQLPVDDTTEVELNSVMSMVQYRERLNAKLQTLSIDPLANRDMIDVIEKQIRHVDTAIKKANPAQLAEGMSQNPIIGRSYVTRPLPTAEIKNAISEMLQKMPNDEDAAVFWIVASTCGGTGNGIVHYVADLVQEMAGRLQLTIKLVRIGSLTYAGLNKLVHLSTLWAVLTDYAYVEEHSNKSKQQKVASQLHIYYIDLPDVGTSKTEREGMVLSSFAAISERNLNDRFKVVFNNLSSSPKVVMARIGEWNKGFDKDSVYHQTLIQLKKLLEHLLTPNFADVLSESEDISWSDLNLRNELQSERRSKTFRSAVSTNYASIRSNEHLLHQYQRIDSISNLENHAHWQKFRSLADKILSESDRFSLRDDFIAVLKYVSDEEPIQFSKVDESKKESYVGSEDQYKQVSLAQRAIARLTSYLLGDEKKTGLFAELYKAWDDMLPYEWHNNPIRRMVSFAQVTDDSRKDKASEGMARFIELYLKIDKALYLIREASNVISDARRDLQTLKMVVDDEVRRMGSKRESRHTSCAGLNEFIGSDTWLQLLRKSLSGDPEQSLASGRFRGVVEEGAKGLTEEGLKHVIGLPPIVDMNNIVEHINMQAGENKAVWWQGVTPKKLSDQYHFSYRVFPRLPVGYLENLESANHRWAEVNQKSVPTYIQVSSISLGLKVYAVECSAPDRFFEQQINQLTAKLVEYIDPQNHLYPKTDEVRDPANWYVAFQCQRSVGLPIYLSPKWKETQGFQQAYEYIEKLSDYFHFISDNNAD